MVFIIYQKLKEVQYFMEETFYYGTQKHIPVYYKSSPYSGFC